MAVDYIGMQNALSDLIAAVNGVKKVFIEAMEKEIIIDHMPLVNVRLVSSDVEQRSLPNGYYEYVTFEVDVMVLDFTNFREAATIRDNLLGLIRDTIQANKHFFAGMETSSLVPTIRFGALSPEGAGGHIALATFTLRCEVYIEAA